MRRSFVERCGGRVTVGMASVDRSWNKLYSEGEERSCDGSWAADKGGVGPSVS